MILIVLYLAESQMKILRCFPSSLHIISKHIIFTIPGLVTMFHYRLFSLGIISFTMSFSIISISHENAVVGLSNIITECFRVAEVIFLL